MTTRGFDWPSKAGGSISDAVPRPSMEPNCLRVSELMVFLLYVVNLYVFDVLFKTSKHGFLVA